MSEVQVDEIADGDGTYTAIAQTNEEFPGLIDRVEVYVATGRLVFGGDPIIASGIYPRLMEHLRDEVLQQSTEQQRQQDDFADLVENI